MKLSNAALITHKACMDGSTCAIVFQAAGGKKENIFFSTPNHDDVDEKFDELLGESRGPIIVADLSVSLKMAQSIYPDTKDIFLLDHHKSAIPLAGPEFPWCEIEVDNHRAGGRMLYDFFGRTLGRALWKEGDPRHFLDLVLAADDIDRWIKDIPESSILATLHNVVGQEIFIKRFLKNPKLYLTENEKYLVDIEETKRKQHIESAKKNLSVLVHNIDGQDVRVAYLLNSRLDQSVLGHAIYEDPALDIDAVVMIGNKSISMRASPTCPLDLSVAAKNLNGGGHKKSSGFSIDVILNNRSLLDVVQEYFREHESKIWVDLQGDKH